METTLRKLCEAHSLTAISVMIMRKFPNLVTVYLHWDHDDENQCASGGGQTFDEAFAKGLVEVQARRSALSTLTLQAAE